MDQSRAPYSGFYFVCKYCNCVFRDKLELFCHQVNDHPEYRQEINVTNRTVQPVNHEMTYSDPRAINVEVKRPSTNFGHHSSSSSQQTNTSNSTTTSNWYPPTAGHVPNHIPSVPNHYYVVVPNQHNNQMETITVPLVNQQIAHASSTLSSSLSSCQQPQQTQQQQQQQQQQQSSSLISQVNSSHDLVTLRNEVGNEWNKVGGVGGGDDSSESDAAVNNKDEYHDYYCWKCKIKFANAANYIAHSSSCLQRGGNQQQQQHDMYDSQSQSPTTYTELESQQQANRKRGRKTKQDQIQHNNNQPQQQQQQHQQQQQQYHNLDVKRRRSNNPNYVEIDLEQEQLQQQQQQQQQTLHQLQNAVLASSSFAAAGLYAVGNSSNNNNNTKNNNSRRKNTGNVLTKGMDSSVANGSTPVVVTTTTERVGNKPEKEKNFPCSHCGLKFSSNDRLSSHLLQCKAKKNPYETYQYKCIKCSESFDIYLQYKRHIAIHTGEVRYS